MTSHRPLNIGISNQEKALDLKTIENAISAVGVQKSTINSLDTQFQQVMALTFGAAGWHGYDDIQTLIGLEGTFLWGENPFGVHNITFEFDPDKIGFQGQYKISNGWSVEETGVFHCVPNNPAIGWAFIGLVPAQSQTPRTFIVSGMFTDSNWKIYNMLLNHVGQSGPVLPAFQAFRLI